MVHEYFTPHWAFGIQGAIGNTVKSAFPEFYRLWPLLNSIDFDGFDIGEGYAVIVLRDKRTGTTAGPSGPLKPYPAKKHPSLPPKASDIEIWQHHFRNVFELGADDAALLIPIYDSEKCIVPEDYEQFGPEEKFFWDQQIKHILLAYRQHLGNLLNRIAQPINHIHASGPNARVYINSTDNSTNSTTIQET